MSVFLKFLKTLTSYTRTYNNVLIHAILCKIQEILLCQSPWCKALPEAVHAHIPRTYNIGQIQAILCKIQNTLWESSYFKTAGLDLVLPKLISKDQVEFILSRQKTDNVHIISFLLCIASQRKSPLTLLSLNIKNVFDSLGWGCVCILCCYEFVPQWGSRSCTEPYYYVRYSRFQSGMIPIAWGPIQGAPNTCLFVSCFCNQAFSLHYLPAQWYTGDWGGELHAQNLFVCW